MNDHRAPLLRSSVARKVGVAVSGGILLLFLVAHMVGNLKAFGGLHEGAGDATGVWAIDAYAHFLRTVGEPLLPHGALLWMVRAVLLAALVVHVLLVVDLARHNRGARPRAYARASYEKASLAARSMLWTGAVVLLFIGVHLMHFTTGSFAGASWDPSEVRAHLAQAFRRPVWVALYLVALATILVHLQHGAWSALQTLGWNDPERDRGLRSLGTGLAILVALGFASVPVAFLLGWVPEAPTTLALEARP